MSIFVAIIMIVSLAACSAKPQQNQTPSDNSASTTPSTTATPEAAAPETTVPETTVPEAILLPLPQDNMEFSYLSGAGGWRSVLVLNRDGTFTGYYSDSEMGEVGEGYPNGSVYTCTFSGTFENIEQVNEFSYKMTIADLKTERAVGEEWIEDEIRYVASEPNGLYDPFEGKECIDYILYLPDTPTDQVPEDFLFWWPYQYTQDTEPKTPLSCYGILNVTTNGGFFTAS